MTVAPMQKPWFAVTEPGSAGRRKIPAAKHIGILDEWIGTNEPKDALVALQEIYGKYTFMQQSFASQLERMQDQTAKLKEPIDVLLGLIERRQNEETEDRMVHYRLTETCYSQAKVPASDTVFLWLGAGVLCEYPLDDAVQLLTKNLDAAKLQIEELEKDLAYLAKQVSYTEVNLSRVQNLVASRAKGLTPIESLSAAC
eukprot:Lankesteria_metandrocarpae@DN833_c0_g1_i1.p1